MSVEIKFEPDGPQGLVAEGTLLADAARRLGFSLPECDGKGASDACAVRVLAGASLMSELTEAERTQLSNERLAGGQRLACQCRIEHGGEVMIKAVSATERSATAAETGRDLRSQFKSLPLERKIATLMQLETMAVTEVFDTFTDRSVAFGRKLFNFVLPHNNPAAQDKSSGQKKRP